MRRLFNYFLRGLVVVAPLAVTIWIGVAIFQSIDSWLPFRVRGVGFVVTVVAITFIGFLASSLVAKGAVSALESLFERLPIVRLLYGSTKDMLNAFVGEKRRFDKPVLVRLSEDGVVKVIGFQTADSPTSIGVEDHVTVYIPQSYGFSGNIILVPSARVTRIDADAAEAMAYIISGGVTNVERRSAAPVLKERG